MAKRDIVERLRETGIDLGYGDRLIEAQRANGHLYDGGALTEAIKARGKP